MDFTALKTELADPAYAGMDDGQIELAINGKPAQVPTHLYFNYRTLAALVGPMEMEAFAAIMAAGLPVTHQILMQVGNTDGSAGGMDTSTAAFQAFADSLLDNPAVSATMKSAVPAIKAMGFRAGFWPELYGFNHVEQGHMAIARAA